MPGVTDLEITIAAGRAVAPVPEGNRYLGFVFARDSTPGPCGTRVAAGLGLPRGASIDRACTVDDAERA